MPTPPKQTLVCPLPQMRLDEDSFSYEFTPGFFFVPLSDDARRCLINTAKRQDCSDATLSVLYESQVIVCKQAPFTDLPRLILFRHLFELMLGRLLECFLISSAYKFWRPPVMPSCQFAVPGTPTSLDFSATIAMLKDWQPRDRMEHFLVTEPFPAKPVLEGLAKCWPRLLRLCDFEGIEHLVDVDDKLATYVAAGNKHVQDRSRQRAENFLEAEIAEHGPERWEQERAGPIPASRKCGEWFFEGFGAAFGKDIRTSQSRLRAARSKVRLHRAFQIFVDSAQLEEPLRFVSLITTLEALLSTGTSELRYQLAARVAWLMSGKASERLCYLEGDRAAKEPIVTAVNESRLSTYNDISDKYNLRSKIIHGDRFSWDKLDENSSDLLWRVKSVFVTILDDEAVFELFMDPDEKDLHKFLKGLPLGL